MSGSCYRFAVLIVVALSCLSACAKPLVNSAPLDEIKAALEGPDSPAYKIGIADEIEVKFFFAPELNDRMQVRPDGRISIMFAQDVQAAGLTPEELQQAIKKALKGRVKQLDLVVVVRNFGSQRIFIGGEVSKPGPVQIPAPQSMLQVLSEAGWLTPDAGPERILLVRRGPNGRDKIYPVDVEKLISGEDMSQNITVRPGDFILVPPLESVAAGRWVDRNIRQIIPFNTSAGAYYNLNRAGLP